MPSGRWKSPYLGADNVIIECDDYMVSYNPKPFDGMGAFRSDGGCDETALKMHRPDDGGYLVLNGDFTAEYEAAFDNGWDACLAVYNKHKDKASSSWTTRDDDDDYEWEDD